ncbi:hypothetical protein KC19_3G186100 [Ceratodon purpureus]|uniref:Uncharacterized protein n=1 Tax=Ceratodon purpureus TaxID=3225 RepID=A0A8T0IK00_CERPU|nr:hypothetical protein KC19_3G186100 [Ceratodon purpureus]
MNRGLKYTEQMNLPVATILPQQLDFTFSGHLPFKKFLGLLTRLPLQKLCRASPSHLGSHIHKDWSLLSNRIYQCYAIVLKRSGLLLCLQVGNVRGCHDLNICNCYAPSVV